MAQLIALSDDARQSFRVILGAQGVRVRAYWQPLDENWYLSLSNLDRTPIISGVRLDEAARPLDGQLLTDFKGALLVDGVGEVGRHAWTTTHKLLYLSEAEAASHATRRAAAAIPDTGYPAKPASFSVSGGDGQASLSFRAGNQGSAALIGWQYRVKEGMGAYGDWIDIPGSDASTTSYTVTGLTNGVTYELQVRVLSSAGWSEPSNPALVTPVATANSLMWLGSTLRWLGDPLIWNP